MKAVITGAANGIGASLARALARSGCEVVGVDKDETSLNLLHAQLGSQFRPQPTDLLVEADRLRLVQQLRGESRIDYMIHSAGINHVAPFARTAIEPQRQVLDLNLRVPMQLSREFLHHDRFANSSHLVFIASLSVYVSYPGASVYAASKVGLASYARSLRIALASRNIRVLSVFPGPTRTEHARRCSPHGEREHRRMEPEDIARRILTAMERRKSTLIPGTVNQLMALGGLAAGWLAEMTMKRAIFDRLPQHDLSTV